MEGVRRAPTGLPAHRAGRRAHDDGRSGPNVPSARTLPRRRQLATTPSIAVAAAAPRAARKCSDAMQQGGRGQRRAAVEIVHAAPWSVSISAPVRRGRCGRSPPDLRPPSLPRPLGESGASALEPDLPGDLTSTSTSLPLPSWTSPPAPSLLDLSPQPPPWTLLPEPLSLNLSQTLPRSDIPVRAFTLDLAHWTSRTDGLEPCRASRPLCSGRRRGHGRSAPDAGAL